MVDDATHVANAVSVRVGEAAWVDLIDDSGLPPVVGGRGGGHGGPYGVAWGKNRHDGQGWLPSWREDSVGADFAIVT